MDGAPTAETGATLGTAFYAPQVRLVNEDGTAILIGEQPVSGDVVSATVTLLNTGVGQAEIVLNNQHDMHKKDFYPLPVPSWRYNKLDTLGFGKRLRVDMRYGSEGWTPMILARITDVVFDFPSAEGAKVTLKGEDLLSLLKAMPDQDKKYDDVQEVDLVSRVLARSASGLTFANRPASPFAEPLRTVTHEKKQSYLQFIQSLAERMDFEVFAAFDNSEPGQAARNPGQPDPRPVSFHFEPARSAVLDGVVTLLWGRDIVDFKPKFKVWDILTRAEAQGSVPRGRGRVTAGVDMERALAGELHQAPKGAAPISAAEVRKRAFAAENRPEANLKSIKASNIDKKRAELQAKAVLRASARSFLTADITTIGFTKLRPGIHVDLKKLYAPFDGIWYVTKTVHTLNASGYITKTSVRRPGMLDANDYPLGGAP